VVVSSLTSGLIRPAFRIDRHQIDVRLGIECAAAIALPLTVGLAAGRPVTAAWGAIGAFLANFSVYQPGYRVRVRIVVVASVVIAAATFLGAVTGIDNPAVFPLIAVWSFLAGLLVALGPSAAMIGVVSSVGLAVATALNATPTEALEDAAAALAGGLGAAVLAFAFHRRGQRAEAAALGAAYRVLAGYAHGISRGGSALPEGTAFDAVSATLARPGPHRTRSLATRDRALAERAERLRTVLAALAVTRDRFAGDAAAEPARRAVAAIDELAETIGMLLDELADCCATDRAPGDAGPASERLRVARRSVAGVGDDRTVPLAELFAEVDELVGSVRRLLADETPDDRSEPSADRSERSTGPARHRARLRSLAHRPDTFDEVRLALRANLTLRSTACRHALRLAVTVTVATVLYRVIDTHDGYWIVVAVLFIMKPDFGSTVGRGILRAVGTLAGVTLTTLLLASLRPGPVVLAVIAVVAAVFAYALFNANYGAFTVFLTCLTVALAAMIGLPAMTAVANRAVDNLIASGLAIMAVVVWPTWVATEVPRLVAACLRAEHRFGDAVLAAFVRPPGRPATEPVDHATADGLVREARLARSNAEAAVERMGAETPGVDKGTLPLAVAEAILAEMHHYGLAGLSLRVHVAHPDGTGLPVLVATRQGLTATFAELAAAVENDGPTPSTRPVLPPPDAIPPTPLARLVAEETGAMATAIDSAVTAYDRRGPRT
jgi:uncharacterized membrane protein YccC